MLANMGEIATGRRHVRRRGILATLSPVAQAVVCQCDACCEVLVKFWCDQADRERINSRRYPLCEFCRQPMIWRSVCFVCPYSETAELHQRIRDLNVIEDPNDRKVGREESAQHEGADAGAAAAPWLN